jgi:hypothetical protein
VLVFAATTPAATFAQDTTRGPIVRSFPFRHLSADAVVSLVQPYAIPGSVSVPVGLSLVTVRGDRQTLATIERLIADFDRPPATITFRFQLIVATDAPPRPDPSIAAVEPLLRDLFRFGGYRLLSHAMINAIPRSNASQTVGDGAERMRLEVQVDGAETQTAPGSVRIQVVLSRSAGVMGPGNNPMRETLLSTGVTIPLGQTVVLGSAVSDLGQRFPDARALILTVQPELAKIGR